MKFPSEFAAGFLSEFPPNSLSNILSNTLSNSHSDRYAEAKQNRTDDSVSLNVADLFNLFNKEKVRNSILKYAVENPKKFLETPSFYPYLFEKNDEGETLAHELAKMGVKELLNKKELWNVPNDYGIPVAFYMAKSGVWSLSPSFLSIRDRTGKTIAHYLAEKYPFLIYENAPFSFEWEDNRGWTVAHELAKRGVKFRITDEIVKKRTKDGVSVLAVMIYHLTREELKKISDDFLTEKIGNSMTVHFLAEKLVVPKRKEKMLLKDKEGKTALFRYLYTLYKKNLYTEEKIEPLMELIKKDKLSLTFLAEKKYFTEYRHREILKLTVDESTGTTVAHVEAAAGKNFKTREILVVSDKYGWTVAHIQALRGELKYSSTVNKLNNEGDAPVHVYVKKGYPLFQSEIFFQENIKGIPAWAYSPNPPDFFLENTPGKKLKKILSKNNVPAKEKIKNFLVN